MIYLLLAITIPVTFLFIQLMLEIKRGTYRKETFSDGKVGEGVFLYNSLFARLFLRGNFVAITIGKLIFVKEDVLREATVSHELRHTVQWKELGFFGFLREYLKENKTVGYQCNRFEEEARRFAGQPTRCS